MNLEVLVIGGTGLISAAIVQQLLDRGDRLAFFNRGSTPVRLRGEVERLHGNRWEPGSLEGAVVDMTAFAPRNGTQLVDTFWGKAGLLRADPSVGSAKESKKCPDISGSRT